MSRQPANDGDPGRGGFLPIDRREYLKYANALALAPFASAAAGATQDSDSANESEAVPDPLPAPDDLGVDYEPAPDNLDPTAEPRFTWRVGTDSRGRGQSAYRVLVASSASTLDDDAGDVWDSGKVESDRSTTVPYDGDALEPDTTYHWKVRVWDEHGQPSPWSDASRFATAIPDADEHWEGEWIGPDYGPRDPGADWADYALDVDFTLVEGSAGFLFRASDEENCYFWHLLPSRIDLWAIEGGGWEQLGQVELDDVSEGERHRLEVTVEGERITTAIDGTTIDERTDGTHGAGSIGFLQFPEQHVRVHSIEVADLEGDVRFAEEFDASIVETFDGGTIEDGALSLDGTNFVMRTDSRPEPLLRREFDLEKEVEEARVHVTGLGFYELYCNGERVGDRVLDPGRTDYEETVLYSTYDVTDQLRNGTNAIGAALGRGRFGELVEDFWDWHQAPWWSDPQVLVQLNVEFADGTSASVVTDENWTMAEGPTRYDSLYGGEIYDAQREKPGWTTAGYDDADWGPARTAEPPGGDYTPQRVQPIRVTDAFEAVEMTEPEDGTYVFDVGQMISGWAELTVEGPAGTTVELTLGETVDEDGFVPNENTQLADPMQTDTYVLKGEGTETWESRFSYKGFRYVQVEGFPGEPSLEAIEGKFAHTVVDEGVESDFACSNDLLNQIHENTRWAMLSNLHSVHTDSPTWEKNGWTEHSIEMGPSMMYNFSMARFWRKFMRDAADEQGENGAIPYILPTNGWGYGDEYGEFGYTNDPGWDAAVVVVPWYAYRYYGDEDFLTDNYETMKRYVEYVRDDIDGHVVRTGLGDWNPPGSPGEPPEGPDIVSTTLYYRSAEIVAEAAELLGKSDDAAEFASLAETIRAAMNDEFFDPEANVYAVGDVDEYRQTSNVYPLAFGLVPDGHADAVAANLAENVMEVHDGHLDVGAHGLQYLLPVLTEHGHLEVAYTIATRTTHPSWGLWIENGVTGLLEHWPLEARSRTHDFLGSIDQWFYQYLAGIQEPAEPGFERITIAPHLPADLESASATTETIRGEVSSAWERNGDVLELAVTIPWNATAEIRVPARYEQAVTEDGVPASDLEELSLSRVEDEFAAFEAGSGSYAFESDPVLGSVGFVRDAAGDLRDRLEDLRSDGHLNRGQANHLDARLEGLTDATEAAYDARLAGGSPVGDVHDALATVAQLDGWVAKRTDRMGDTAAEELQGTLSRAFDELSHASKLLLDVETELTVTDDVRAGGDVRVTATIHNGGNERLNDLSLSLEAPDGWEVSSASRTGAGTLEPGGTFTGAFDVSVPLDQAPSDEAFELSGLAEYRNRGGSAAVPMAATVGVGSPVRISGVSAGDVDPGEETTVETTIENLIDSTVPGTVSLELPDGWNATSGERSYEVAANGETTVTTTVVAPADAGRGRDTAFESIARYAGHVADRATAELHVPLDPIPDAFSTFASTDARFGTDGDAFVIRANGEDVWEDADEYGALYRPDDSAGDETTVTVKVARQDHTDDWAKAGVMIRNDVTDAGGSGGYVALMVTAANGFELEWDSDEDGYVDSSANAGETTYPGWLRLEKSGDTFTGYYSTDGETWTTVGSADVPGVADAQDVAMFSTSHAVDELGYAAFEEYSID